MFLLQRLDFLARKKREIFQVLDDIAVIGVDPELVKAIHTGPLRIKPDRASHRFPELRAIRIGDERQREAIGRLAQLLADEIDAGRDVAPLVAPANLQLTMMLLAQMIKIKRLEQHV